MRLRLAPIALLSVAAMWGAAFVLMKDAIKREDVNSFLFTRFAVAAVVMIVLKPKVSKYFSPDLLVKGFIAGSFLGSGYILQTLGLARTTAAVTGFVTGMYVIATPLIAALVLHQRISRRTWVYVLIATLGLALLSLHGWSVGSGELLVLCSSIAFACHIIALGQWSSGRDAYAFTVIQLATCALLAGLAIFATAIAFIIQTWSQAHMSSTKVAVILTMEVVFAAIFAVIFGGERLTLQIALGGALVVTAMYMIVLQEA
jgi:drug/metabolite transporter (DMT)-like permease